MAAPPLIILAGPTAVGKTNTALLLARAINAEIINADSVQVYKGLDIGSAKPAEQELALVRHYLLNVCEAHESMDAGIFVKLAGEAIDAITARGKNVLVVGGTGLYIKALLFGLAAVPAINPALRDELRLKLEQQGLASLRDMLAELDPEGAVRIRFNDKQRTMRALEVVLQTGHPLAYFYQSQVKKALYPYLLWGLELPRGELKERIAVRSRQMWQNGLLAEVEGLMAGGLDPKAPALSSLGYRQALAVALGQMNNDEALAQMINRTQAYAKRQVTWFKKMDGIKWVNPEKWEDMVEPSRDFLQTQSRKTIK